jgi:hypothetical protein
MAVFWVVAPRSLVEVYQRFRGPCCLHHQGDVLHIATSYEEIGLCYKSFSKNITQHVSALLPSSGAAIQEVMFNNFTCIIAFCVNLDDSSNAVTCWVIFIEKCLQHITSYGACVKLRLYLMDNEIAYMYL